jgi:hypothetical protein
VLLPSRRCRHQEQQLSKEPTFLQYIDGMSSSGNHDDDNRFTITARDLLQANATIIAGALILLSISTSVFREQPSDELFPALAAFSFFLDVLIVSIGMLPFVLSCRFLLMEFKNKEHGFRRAKRLTYYGLLGLFAVIVYFLFISPYLLVSFFK